MEKEWPVHMTYKKVQTRSNSASFEYKELSPPRTRGRIDGKVQATLVHTRRTRSTPPTSFVVVAKPVTVPGRRNFQAPMARQFAFIPFNQGSPLNFSQHHEIHLATLKILLDFTREGHTTKFEHIRDVAMLCNCITSLRNKLLWSFL